MASNKHRRLMRNIKRHKLERIRDTPEWASMVVERPVTLMECAKRGYFNGSFFTEIGRAVGIHTANP